MPLITGIAALAVLNPTMDLTSIDPQVDRQFAYVKTPPAVALDENPVQGIAVAPPQSAAIEIAVTGQAAQSRVVEGTIAPRYAIAADPAFSLGTLKGMDRKVSVSLNNVTAAEALKWVGKQNVNYVVNLDTLPKSKISLNMKDVPLAEALSSIAEVLGGSWQVKGSTLLFRGGFGFSSAAFAPLGETRAMLPSRAYGFDGKALENLKFREVPALRFEGKTMAPLEMQKVHEEFSKHIHEFKIDKEAFERMHKEFDTVGKLRIEGHQLSKEQLEKLEKELAITLKTKDGAFLHLKQGDILKASPNGQAFGLKKVDGAKLLKSLTEEQRTMMKRQGYLKISDLTKEQKEMIFTDPKAEIKGDFSFILNLDGEKITIKS